MATINDINNNSNSHANNKQQCQYPWQQSKIATILAIVMPTVNNNINNHCNNQLYQQW
jgi:hypothetical protein